MDVQFNCVIEKASVEEEKMSFSHTASTMQYEWKSKGNLAYLNEDMPETLLFLYKANYKYYRLTLTPQWKRLQF